MNWIRDCLSSNSSVDQKTRTLRDKISTLIARESDVRTEVEHAEIQPGNKRRREVDHWLTTVQAKIDEVQSILKDGQDQGSSSNSNFTGRLDRLIAEVGELMQQGDKFRDRLVLFVPESTRLEMWLGKKPTGTNFQKNYERILEWLQHQENHIIGVYGMGGVGKTTLLMKIHDELLTNSDLYGRVYWVTVSQNWSVHKLQGDIAKVLGLGSLEEDDKRKRAAILHKKIVANGLTVLILDDMWKQFSENDVGNPLEGSSCKTILTTRSLEVCRRMGCKDFVIKAEILHEVEAWELFVDNLGHYDTLTMEAKEIARDVAKECGGLPLAITTMACCMRDIVDIHEWKNALKDLKDVRGQVDMEDDVLRVLQYSYDRLNDKLVQNCFLSCILYPEDKKIKRTTLIDLWINEGLLDEMESMEEQVNKGYSVLNKLANWCLLESTFDLDEEECVKMHDLIRDMAIMITKESPRFMAKSGLMFRDVPKDEQWSKDLKKVSLSHNDIEDIPCGMTPVTPHLTVLLFCHNYHLSKIPESFFMHMRSLTVLDLSHTNIESLPESVSNLENLRALLLEGCEALSKIPDSFFMHIRSLTVLDLSYTKIESLPESVSNLENLRALLLQECGALKDLPSVAKLTKLRILKLHRFDGDIEDNYMEPPKGIESLNLKVLSFGEWEMFDDVIRFNRLIKSWQGCDELSWRRLELKGKDADKSFYDYCIFYDFHVNPQTLLIASVECKEELPILPSTIRRLAVFNINAFEYQSLGNLLPSLAGTKELESLLVGECEGLEYILTSEVVPSLDSLEYLWVNSMPDFRGLSNSLSVVAFSHIKMLVIQKCPKIKVLFPGKLLQQDHALFPLMETLEVVECDELEEIFEGGGRDSYSCSSLESEKVRMLDLNASNPNHNSILVDLPKLRELNLWQLPKLRRIYRHLHLCTLLEYLTVGECAEIEPSEPTLSLPTLRELHLQNLPKFSSIYIVSLMCTSLRKLVISDLACMKVVFPCKLVEQEQSLLPNLEELRVSNCDELEEIFEGGGRYSSRSQSEKVTMLDLNASNPNPNPILVHLPKLYELTLWQLPKLRRIYRHLHLCPSLTQLRVQHCAEIEQIFEASKPTLAIPQLWRLKLDNLPKLNSIHRGLLVCKPLCAFSILSIDNCWKLKTLSLLSEGLICDASPTSLLSLPTDSEDPELWDLLRSKYRKDACFLSEAIQRATTHQLKRKRKWGASLSLSLL
ncbi:hypothetical protein BVRB_4g087580 [Beta vulgaris subsp. vulgaris]|nr:hypothetical protein BVRB_4g087580 [Beta vulgaris subsp. vulgaris]